MKMAEERTINQLKLHEIKAELEKRPIQAVGSKMVLMKRLEKILIKEGKDPAVYVFKNIGIQTKKARKESSEEIVYTNDEKLGDIVVDEVGVVDSEGTAPSYDTEPKHADRWFLEVVQPFLESRGRADRTNIGKRPVDKVEPEVQDVPMKDTVKDDELEKINIDAKMDDEIDEIEKSPKLADLTITDEDVKTKRTPFFKQIFNGIRKKASVRAKERKIRQNRDLRKLFLPKNALMALNEMKGIRISDFVLDTKGVGGFTALVTINGVEYEGVGPSKSAAKSDACEKALRDNIIKKMSQKPGLGSQSTDAGGENSEEVPANGGTQDDADDVLMINLASFAIYKLFTAWQNEGYTIPDFHNTPQTPNQSIDKPSPEATGRTELPPNWESMHPATLLCIMRPQLAYLDCGGSLDNGNLVQNVKVNVDGREFVGVGRSKKLARKNVATSICNILFGTNFPIDN